MQRGNHALLALRSRCRSSMLFVFRTPRRLLPCSTCSSLSLRRLLIVLIAPADSIVHIGAVFRLWAGHIRGCYLWGPFRAAGSSSLCEIQISRGPACDRLLVYHFRTLADPTLLSAVQPPCWRAVSVVGLGFQLLSTEYPKCLAWRNRRKGGLLVPAPISDARLVRAAVGLLLTPLPDAAKKNGPRLHTLPPTPPLPGLPFTASGSWPRKLSKSGDSGRLPQIHTRHRQPTHTKASIQTCSR